MISNSFERLDSYSESPRPLGGEGATNPKPHFLRLTILNPHPSPLPLLQSLLHKLSLSLASDDVSDTA